jgi:hypothetical protein
MTPKARAILTALLTTGLARLAARAPSVVFASLGYTEADKGNLIAGAASFLGALATVFLEDAIKWLNARWDFAGLLKRANEIKVKDGE